MRHLAGEDLATWKDYLKVRTIGAYARVLPAAFVEASFDFNSRTLRGTETLRPRWKRAVQETDNAMGEAIGAAYVARHFPPEAKARMVTLVDNLLAEFDRGIDRLDWMSPATRKEAHAKLGKISVKIAYPDKWRDYTGLEIRGGRPRRQRDARQPVRVELAGGPRRQAEGPDRMVHDAADGQRVLPANE